jgi:peptidoglycan hydrolase CwlO-like protein
LYSLLPVALTVVLLGYTASSVRNAQKQVDALKTEATTYTTQIDTLKKNAETYTTQSQSLQGDSENHKNQVTELQAQLAEAQNTLRSCEPEPSRAHYRLCERPKKWPAVSLVAKACCWTFSIS